MYMSYCRFEGTLHELRACIGEVVDHINEEAEYKVDDREIGYFRAMVEELVEFLCYETEIIDEHGELNEEALDSVCEKMKESWEEEYE